MILKNIMESLLLTIRGRDLSLSNTVPRLKAARNIFVSAFLHTPGSSPWGRSLDGIAPSMMISF